MADQPVTIEKLINADIDVENLGKAANELGIVVPRYGDPYKTIPQIASEYDQNSATKGFATLAEFEAVKATIPAHSVITIGEAGPNQGQNFWDGTTLAKSAYDPLTQAKGYTDDQIALIPIEQINLYDYSFVIKDKNGVPAVGMLLDKDGKPSIYMLNSIFDGLVNRIVEKVTSEIELSGVSTQQSPDGSFFVVDSSGKRSWLEAGLDGLPTEWAKTCIAQAIGTLVNVVPDKVKSSYQNQEIKAVSGPNIICIGDSMTFGVGATTYNYPLYLKKLLSDVGSTAQVFNAGVGGESSASIAARQGANPFIVNPFTIPADKTPVTITLGKVNGLDMYPLYQGNGEGDASGGGATLRRYFDGEIAGVKGRLSLVQPSAVGTVYNRMPDDYYTFTRAESGTAVSVARPVPFYLDYAKQHWGDIHIIWVGQNNGADQDRAIADTKAIIQKMEALDKRYLVISKPVSSTEATTKAERDALDAKFFAEFGRRFIPIRQYLIEYGLQDAGITPTAQDNIDIANGQVPQSLRTDTVHFTTPAYISTAQQIFNRLNELGWI